MGQSIVVEAAVIGSAVVFSTDRSITGQDGVSYSTAAEAAADDRFPGHLALRLFEADGDLASVFTASNQVVVSGEGEWPQDRVETLSAVISDFFLFYPVA